MKNCGYCLILFALLLPGSLFAQTDTVEVPSDWGVGEGGLNTAIQAKIDAGTLSNTVFRLKPYGLYILSSRITVPAGKRLTLIAPDPGASQETSPPMICWTPSSGVNTNFNFDCFGDIYMKNIWILYATSNTDGLGTQVGSALEIDEDTTDYVNVGVFENVIFDYAPISNSGGSVTVTASHARLTFKNCYFRNNTDTHFRYYGRAVSFPYNTQGWHVDTASFENCTFANMGYVIMQEGAEWYDYVRFNHCTFLNTIMYTLEFGWWRWLSVTNCLFQNAYMFGWFTSEGTTPHGGAINIDSISTYGFSVPYTESERHILFANNSYYIEKWLRDYMAPYDPVTNPTGGNPYSNAALDTNMPRPQPIMSEKTKGFFNDKVTWPYITLGNVDTTSDPGFLIPPTNQFAIKVFLLKKWTDNSDTTWAFDPHSDINEIWPMNELLRYSNSTLKTAAMGGLPLGDLYHWSSATIYSNWKAQSATENQTITNLLTNGSTAVSPQPSLPLEFELSQNYPNPFNPTTEIRYSVPQRGVVSLKVYSILGQEVATLFNGERQAGTYRVTFDGSQLSSGVYFYTLKGGNVSITKKLVLM